MSSSPSGGLLTHIRRGLVNQEFPLPGGELLTLAVGKDAVWVGMRTPRGNVLLDVDPKNGRVRRTVPIGISDVQSIAVGEGSVWALAGEPTFELPTLIRIDPASGRVTAKKTIETGGGSMAAVAAGYGAVWGLASGLGTPAELIRIDPRTLAVTKRIAAPESRGTGAYGVGIPNLALGEGAVWWNGVDTGTMWRVDPRSGRILSTVRLTRPIDEQNPPSVLSLFEPLSTAVGAGGTWVSISHAF